MHIICRQIAVLWLCTLRKQCTYCIIVSTLQFNRSNDVTVDDLDRFDLFFFLILRLTICPVVNFVFLHRHENSYLLFHSRFSLILFIFLVFKLIVIFFLVIKLGISIAINVLVDARANFTVIIKP